MLAVCPWDGVSTLTCGSNISLDTLPAGELDGEMSEVQSMHSTMFGMQSVGQVSRVGKGGVAGPAEQH